MKYALPICLVALSLAACSQPADKPATQGTDAAATPTTQQALEAAVTVTDAWCRTSPNGAKAGGCYLTLTAATDDVLTAVSTDQAEMAQVHEMKHEDGMMKMAHLQNGLPLPAGQATVLKPHSNHLMLMGLKSPLVEGQTAKITLTFAKAPAQTIDFAIRTPEVVDSQE